MNRAIGRPDHRAIETKERTSAEMKKKVFGADEKVS
jgi:hypothetical protein